MSYIAELHFRVYDDDTGEYVSVGPDADGLDCAEIRYCDRDGKILARITTNKEMMQLVHSSLGQYLSQMK